MRLLRGSRHSVAHCHVIPEKEQPPAQDSVATESGKEDADDFKAPENFVSAFDAEEYHNRKYYFDPSSVKITVNNEKLKEWSQDWLIYDTYSKKTFKVNYNFCWDDPEDGTRRIDEMTAVKFDKIFGGFFLESWECAFNEKYSGKRVAVYTNYPEKDTWVLNWEGVDYFVKAHSLDYIPYNLETAPQYSCDVAYNGEIHNFDFVARGYATLKIDGGRFVDPHESKFVGEIYDAICYRVIHQYSQESLSIQARTFDEEKGGQEK